MAKEISSKKEGGSSSLSVLIREECVGREEIVNVSLAKKRKREELGRKKRRRNKSRSSQG